MKFNNGSIDLTKEEIENLKNEAHETNRSVRNLMSLIVKEYLSKKKQD